MQLPRWSPRRRTRRRTPALLTEGRAQQLLCQPRAYNHPDSRSSRQHWEDTLGGFFPQEPVPVGSNKSVIFRDKYSGLQRVAQASGHKARGGSPAALEQQVLCLVRKVSRKSTRETQNRNPWKKVRFRQLKVQSALSSVEAWQTLPSLPVCWPQLPPSQHTPLLKSRRNHR